MAKDREVSSENITDHPTCSNFGAFDSAIIGVFISSLNIVDVTAKIVVVGAGTQR